jgi:hypothetical protein
LCRQRILHRADPSSKEYGFRNSENGIFCEVMASKAIKIYIHRSYNQKYPKLKYTVIKKKLDSTERLFASSCFPQGILKLNPREK